MRTPRIGITVDNRDNDRTSGKYESPIAYSRAVAGAGALPLLLPHEVEFIPAMLDAVDGVMLTGGDDVRMETFGDDSHPACIFIDEQRQAFEIALLQALRDRHRKPVLGICLGMQLMTLTSGGRLIQHLPDVLGDEPAQRHRHDNRHPVLMGCRDSVLRHAFDGADSEATIVSAHHQGVKEPGSLRIVATAPDGVIEAIDDPARPFYLGVQWHPERGGEGPLNSMLFQAFADACREASSGK